MSDDEAVLRETSSLMTSRRWALQTDQPGPHATAVLAHLDQEFFGRALPTGCATRFES